MSCKIEIKCLQCNKISNIITSNTKQEYIDFTCPYCGKHELLVAYDMFFLRQKQADDK